MDGCSNFGALGRYDLELHMVHVSPQPDGTNKTAVVGILYNYGSPDPLLSKVHGIIFTIKEEQKLYVILHG